MFDFAKRKEAEEPAPAGQDLKTPVQQDVEAPGSTGGVELPTKSFFMAALPVFACGAGLFSDGYVNNVSLAGAFRVINGDLLGDCVC